jgi:hypothetical protein
VHFLATLFHRITRVRTWLSRTGQVMCKYVWQKQRKVKSSLAYRPYMTKEQREAEQVSMLLRALYTITLVASHSRIHSFVSITHMGHMIYRRVSQKLTKEAMVKMMKIKQPVKKVIPYQVVVVIVIVLVILIN